jgi:predicted aminopeptidase
MFCILMKNAAAFLALGLLLLSGCVSQAGYLVKQGGYLLRDGSGARPVDRLLKTSSTPADTRDFLLLVQEIKTFAFREVGLRDNGNYSRYKELSRDHLVDVVSACDAASFAPYMWKYPFLGKLPYKGFYEKPDADAEAARLKKEGWDVITRPVDAFSTLGFTKDPLYSFMKKYPPFELASLIIHEQTHATLFVKGQPQFNEELAVFVGDEGALQWMGQKYGPRSKEFLDAVDQQADSALFIGLLRGLSDELNAVYKGPQSREEKLSRKAQIINDFQNRLGGERAARFRTEGYRDLGKLRLNNAYLSLYSLYTDDVPLLRSYWEKRCASDLRTFMQAAITLSKKGDVKAQMREQLASS